MAASSVERVASRAAAALTGSFLRMAKSRLSAALRKSFFLPSSAFLPSLPSDSATALMSKRRVPTWPRSSSRARVQYFFSTKPGSLPSMRDSDSLMRAIAAGMDERACVRPSRVACGRSRSRAS